MKKSNIFSDKKMKPHIYLEKTRYLPARVLPRGLQFHKTPCKSYDQRPWRILLNHL